MLEKTYPFLPWQSKDYKGIDVKIIMSENDPANLLLYKVFYIRKVQAYTQFLRI